VHRDCAFNTALVVSKEATHQTVTWMSQDATGFKDEAKDRMSKGLFLKPGGRVKPPLFFAVVGAGQFCSQTLQIRN